ncbi:MAG: ABC transporter permease [Caldilineales bacterium]|nr:ABC transporter permease [Caldilineales bacterium]
MFSPRWRKVLRDILSNKRRTFLVVLSIAVGIFAVGTVAHMRVIVTDDMVESYEAANPPSAILYTEQAFSDNLVEAVRRMPEVAAAEGRRNVVVRFQHPQDEAWYPLRLYAAPDYEDMQINILRRETLFGPDPAKWPDPGVYPPPDHEVLIERTSVLLASQGLVPHARQGDAIRVEMPSGKRRDMRMAGMVYDSVHGAAPWTGMAYGYVNFDTMEWLGLPRTFNELHIIVSGDHSDADHIEQVARQVKDRLERSGVEVARTDVPTPGKLPQDSTFQTLVLLLTVLGVISLGVSVFLLINTVSALLAQQVRQIGVMKAVGANTRQIARMYLGMVLVFGLLALAIAAPLSAWAAREIINFMSYFVNFTLGEFSIPAQVLALEAGMALLVPLVAGIIPVLHGTRLTIREAISSYGLSESGFGQGRLDQMIERLRGLPRPLLLSLRNTLRRKGRLALTLTTLTLAGAIFMAVVHVRTSLLVTLDEVLQYFAFDMQVQFDQNYRLDRLTREALAVPGVVEVEGWGSTSTFRVRPDGSEGEMIYVDAPPAETTMLNPILLAGRWLLPDDENALVVSSNLLTAEPDLSLGDEIVLHIDDQDMAWRIVGVARIAQPVSIAYMNYDYFARLTGNKGRANIIAITADGHSLADQEALARRLETHLAEAGLNVGFVQTISQARAAIDVLFNVVILFLMSMAIVLAFVGGIGLTGTMSLNVLERIREVGVMRAIGASSGSVMQVFIVEGVFIGLISWLFGAVLAIPIGKVISMAVGNEIMGSPLSFVISAQGMLIWLAAVVILSAIASYLPANQAARLSVRQVLAYEQ